MLERITPQRSAANHQQIIEISGNEKETTSSSVGGIGGSFEDQQHQPVSFAGSIASPTSEHVVGLGHHEATPSPSCALCLYIPASLRC